MTLNRQYYTDNKTGFTGYLTEQHPCLNLKCTFRTKDSQTPAYCPGLKLTVYFYEIGMLKTVCKNELCSIIPTTAKQLKDSKDNLPTFSFYEF